MLAINWMDVGRQIYQCLSSQRFDAVGRKGIRPVKKLSGGVLAWLYLSGVRCRLAYGPADATGTHCLLLQ